ncbi:MAG: chorismate--pyruvate lyase [Zymomonas sp.]|nr:chorismate--pyruvate lyase [Zymomonas sp.]
MTDPHWRARPPKGCSAAQLAWLGDHASLTARLRRLGAVAVAVQREGVSAPLVDEWAALGVAAGAPLWCREVLLRVDGVACVYARSVTPLGASHRAWRAIRALGTRPLAELLYASADVSRSGLASWVVTPAHPLYCRMRRHVPDRLPHAILARRSVFYRHAAPLLVTECLLPPLWRVEMVPHREQNWALESLDNFPVSQLK